VRKKKKEEKREKEVFISFLLLLVVSFANSRLYQFKCHDVSFFKDYQYAGMNYHRVVSRLVSGCF
jgi:hypothetical protein